MNTYPTTPEQLYLAQKMRDDNNPGCIEYNNQMSIYRKKLLKTEKQKQNEEKQAKKYKEDEIAGYASKRYDFPEYQWWMIQDGKKYYRSSCNTNVYDEVRPSVIIGKWNENQQRIEFSNELSQRICSLEETVFKLTTRLAELTR